MWPVFHQSLWPEDWMFWLVWSVSHVLPHPVGVNTIWNTRSESGIRVVLQEESIVLLPENAEWFPRWHSQWGTCLPKQETKEMQVWSLGQEDLLEEEMATHSSTFAWRIPWTEEPGGLQFMQSQRVRHSWTTNTQKSQKPTARRIWVIRSPISRKGLFPPLLLILWLKISE